MRRRDFIIGAGAAATWPLAARAQATIRPVIGLLDFDELPGGRFYAQAFLAGLAKLGYVDGKSATIVARYAGGNPALLPTLAADIASFRPDVIAADAVSSIKAVTAAAPGIPIVGLTMAYPVEQGLIASFAHPGGNVTGMASTIEDMDGKLIDFALRAIPVAKSIGFLAAPGAAIAPFEQRAVVTSVSKRGLGFHTAQADTPEDLDAAMRTIGDAGAALVIVQISGMFFAQRERIAVLALANRLPAVSVQKITDTGFLLNYGVDSTDNYRQATSYIDRILKGAKPGDLPVEFPSKIPLTINLKTAKALGLKIPQELLNIADQVIE